MNYRHQYHAGNFADVFKHAVLLDILRRLQRKEKGILYLDTHAGRGGYDLAAAARGDTLERKPEHPEGWGRLTGQILLPPPLQLYVDQVRGHQQEQGRTTFYPGSPKLIQRVLRPQDRMHLCEQHPEEFDALSRWFGGLRRVSVQASDGYRSVAAVLPPPERRALVLVDPPYEAQDEFDRVGECLREGLRRLPGGCFVLWYPLSRRAGAGDFLQQVALARPAPALAVELSVAGPEDGLPLWGSGMLVLNPPYGAEGEWREWLPTLAEKLRQTPRGKAEIRWLVPE